jgi:23S rRNA (adenine2030-N6)-methyltransferase
LNYRHAFHAGNFADLVKHAALLQLLGRLTAAGAPLTVVDTHAGRGVYDLVGPEARKSGEAEAGVVRLMQAQDAPAEFGPLTRAVAALNSGKEVRRYPGSPWLIAHALRPTDYYVACELRRDEHEALRLALAGRANVRTLCADGYAVAAERTPAGRALILIDPPFERPDDYGRIVETLAAARRRNRAVQAMVWLPLKDLETFDGFLRDLEDALPGPLLVAEARVRPLDDPMKMNGCALVFLGAPDLAPALASITGWVAQTLGEAGGSRVYRLGPGARSQT